MRRKFKKADFEAKSILPGFKEGEFCHLSDDDKAAILVLLSRIQESAYRRGVQQGLTYATRFSREIDALKHDAIYNRFKLPPDIAPPYDVAGSGKKLVCMPKKHVKEAWLSSMQRLDMEHGRCLAKLGLYIMECEE